MDNFVNLSATRAPFPSPIMPQMQFPYTTPIPPPAFQPTQTRFKYASYPSESSTSTSTSNSLHSLSHPFPPPDFGFEKLGVTDLVPSQPAYHGKVTRIPIHQGFGNIRENQTPPANGLILAPLTCSKTTIHIVVEENGKIQKFPIHRSLLCFYSPYFRRVLADSKIITAKIRQKNHRREWRWEDEVNVNAVMAIGGSVEGEEKMDVDVLIKFPDAAREIQLDAKELGDVGRIVLASFVNWLYHGYSGFGMHLPIGQQTIDSATLVKLWVFAGRIGVPECQNHCIEGIEWLRLNSNVIETSLLDWVYENTSNYPGQECPLRMLLIDQCAWNLDGNWLLGELDDVKNETQFPRQALVDLVSRMRIILSMNNQASPPFVNSELRKQTYWLR